MTITSARPGVEDVIADIAKNDEGTAALVVEMITYDALCDEVDRVQPWLDRDMSRVMAKRAEGALEAIAKRWRTAEPGERAELEEMAGQIASLAIIAKADDDEAVTQDDPRTKWWDARTASGEFAARGAGARAMRVIGGTSRDGKGPLVGGLNLFTTNPNSDVNSSVKSGLERAFHGSPSDQRYRAARALGQSLQSTGTPGVSAVGSITRLVGDIGPEAQKVFGRGLTRLAYRYRGTERRPDPEIRAAVQHSIRMAEEKNARTPDGRTIPAGSRRPLSDATRLGIMSNVGAKSLVDQVPDYHLAQLSLKAGRVPPSRGVIFDAQGSPVSESVGFNGDHYLPFDLKNLKRLRGGAYVRTRTSGGFTDEDIYTGLLTGARQVTVVSNSGVFTLEFDPSLRGGRRYSDKARQMVKRYSALVSTIGQGEKDENFRVPIPREEMAKIRQAAYEKPGAKRDKELRDKYVREGIQEYALKQQFEGLDEAKLKAAAKVAAEKDVQGSGQKYSAASLAQLETAKYYELRRQEQAKMVRYYRLDGEGYEAAQKALEQEFPYFIRGTRYTPLDEWIDRNFPPDRKPSKRVRPGKDIGYTRRGALAPYSIEGDRRTDTAGTASGDATSGNARSSRPGFGQTAVDSSLPEAVGWANVGVNTRLTSELADALHRSLRVRERLTDPGGVEKVPAEQNASDQDALSYTEDPWSDWILHQRGGAAGAARFLTTPDPGRAEHLDKARRALLRYKDEMPKDDPDFTAQFDGFDEALKLVAEAKMAIPFATPSRDDMVTAAPGVDNPLPQPFPEIADHGPDLAQLRQYAEDEPEIATEAQQALTDEGEKELVRKIRLDLRQVAELKGWPKTADGTLDETHTPSDPSLTVDAARAYQSNPKDDPLYQELERRQKAWALARAVKATAVHQRSGAIPDIGPKETVAQSAPRDPSQWHPASRSSGSRTSSAVQKRSPARRSPLVISKRSSASQRLSSSIPPLAVELAKRLTEDPHYLERFLPARRSTGR